MTWVPPRYTLHARLFPDTTLFRSGDVQTAQKCLRLHYVVRNLRLGADIGAQVDRVIGTQFGDGIAGFFVVDVEQGNLAAVRDQMLSNSEAEAGDAARDDGEIGRAHG